MRFRRHPTRVAAPAPSVRTPRAQDTALFRGALIEIQRLDAENKTLRARLAARDTARDERTLDMRGEWVRNGREDY